jgi:hypothetical protein
MSWWLMQVTIFLSGTDVILKLDCTLMGQSFTQNKQTSTFIMSLLKNTYSQPPLGLLTQTYVILLHHVYTRKCIFHGKITQEWILWTRMVTDSVTSGQERMMGNKTYMVTTSVDSKYLLIWVLTPECLFFDTFWHSSALVLDWPLIKDTRASTRVLN